MKSAKEVWSFVKPYIGKYYLAFLLGGVFWMLLDVYATKGIDTSFVSAIMDTVMACAAVLALIEAKKIWLNKSKEEAYRISLGLLNNMFIKTVMEHRLNLFLFSNYGVISSYLALNEKWDMLDQLNTRERELLELLIKQQEQLEKKLYNSIFPLSQEVQFDILRMRHTGVNFSDNECGDMLKNHFSDFLTLSITCENYLQCIKYFIRAHQTGLDNDEITILHNRDIVESYLNEMMVFNKSINEIVKTNRKNLNWVTTQKSKTIKDYFNYS